MSRRVFALGALAFVAASSAAEAGGQVADSTAAPVPQNCVLEWGAVPGRAAPALRHTESPGGEVADFFSGRTRFTCGTATMEADSAVSYETRGEVYLVGNVAYQDSVRSLDSEILTYYERPDLIIASGDVRLVRRADNSTLEGPQVEFIRAVSGVDELTVATSRPHMTFYPEGDEPGEPFEVDADRIVFAGEDEARAYGEVLIERSDLRGEADSIRLTRVEEMGWMWGDPWIDAEDVRLEGDTIRFRSEGEELKEVHAIGEGRALGESFEVIGEIIDVALTGEEPERVWAYGEGLSRALSAGHDLYGDSLEFAMFEGSIDTVFAVGQAVAVSGGEGLDRESSPADSTGAQTADSTAVAAPDSIPTVPVEAAEPDSAARTVPDSSALAVPDSTALAVPDSTAVAVPDSTAMAVPDSTALTIPDSTALTIPDSTALTISDSTALTVTDSAGAVPDPGAHDEPEPTGLADSDSVAVGPPSETGPPSGADPPQFGRVVPPVLPMDGDAIWVKGDTLIGVFERPRISGERDSTVAAPDLLPPDDSVAVASTLAEGALSGVDSLALAEAGSAPADSSSDPVMERLIVIGDARAFYSQIRDSTKTTRRSKNYMIARRIDVLFEDGDPARVTGVEAIGVFLDPEDASQVAPAETGAVPSAAVPDSIAPPASIVPPDSTGVPPDTTGLPPDTTGVRRRTPATADGEQAQRSLAGPGGLFVPAVAVVRPRRGRWWRG